MSNPTAQVLDVDRLMDHVESDLSLLGELVELFQDFSPELLDLIRGALERGDCSSVRESAHMIKGALSNFYATEAVEAARELENAGRDNRLDDAKTLFGRLEENIDQMKVMLEKLCDQ